MCYVVFAAPTGAPQNFVAQSTSASEIKLQWDAPEDNEVHGDLKGYKVTYSRQEHPTESIKVEDPQKKVRDKISIMNQILF